MHLEHIRILFVIVAFIADRLPWGTLINNKLFVDAFYFHSKYSDFIAAQNFYQSNTGSITDFATNAYRSLQFNFNNNNEIFVNGFGIGLDYALPGGFNIGGNYAHQVGSITLRDAAGNIIKDRAGNEVKNVKMSNPEVSQLGRNFFISAADRYNVSFGNPRLFGNFGFNITYR